MPSAELETERVKTWWKRAQERRMDVQSEVWWRSVCGFGCWLQGDKGCQNELREEFKTRKRISLREEGRERPDGRKDVAR